jgi:hypothetical protein
VGSGVAPADADVMQAAAQAQGDASGLFDSVSAEPVVVSVRRSVPGVAWGRNV